MEITNTPPPSTCAISVVIPMYNAEKYIGPLLESLLAQTFKNFEVIITDDCSTDSCCEVVENYISKFDGRLKLSHMKQNSGGPGAPTNKGIAHARGKYIYQMDNDDLLTNNALEVFYNYAETFNADVVYMSSIFTFNDDPQNPVPAPENIVFKQGAVTKPVFDPEDRGKRIELFCKSKYSVPGWRKFVRRDLLIENEISLQEDAKASQDIAWTIELVYHAKRLLRIPDPLYIYRIRPTSISRAKRPGTESIKYGAHLLIKGVQFLCKFFAGQKFLQENPKYIWMLLNWRERRFYKRFDRDLSKFTPQDFQKIFSDSIADECKEHSDLVAYFCTSLYLKHIKENQYVEKINQLEARVSELEKLQTVDSLISKLELKLDNIQ